MYRYLAVLICVTLLIPDISMGMSVTKKENLNKLAKKYALENTSDGIDSDDSATYQLPAWLKKPEQLEFGVFAGQMEFQSGDAVRGSSGTVKFGKAYDPLFHSGLDISLKMKQYHDVGIGFGYGFFRGKTAVSDTGASIDFTDMYLQEGYLKYAWRFTNELQRLDLPWYLYVSAIGGYVHWNILDAQQDSVFGGVGIGGAVRFQAYSADFRLGVEAFQLQYAKPGSDSTSVSALSSRLYVGIGWKLF